MTKHQVAFKWSAERLFQSTGHLSFWTFTFRKVHNAWVYPRLWGSFCDSLKTVGSDFLMGIRVVEIHPGGHGFHYHCLFNEYLDARRVWSVCRKHDMGCHAVKVRKGFIETQIMYLAKYLTKDSDFPVRVRRWGAIFGFPCYPVNDLKFVHPRSDSVTYLTKLWSRGSYGGDVIGKIYDSPNCNGDYRTLLVGLDYQQRRVCDSFSWTESRMEQSLVENSSFVSVDDTIYNPGLMPQLLPEIPF